jgi:putative ABC transport system permease protein
MLTLRNISKYYAKEGNVALGLRKINLTLSRGELIAVVGESGSGKSTLLNVISGLDTYEDGELLFNGEETSYYSKADWEAYRRDNVGFVFQDYHLIDSFTVYQNVETALILAGASKEERKKRALELIDRVGLTAYKHTKVSKLSGGQMQRTVIARALAKDSPIIAADEPTGHLDAATGNQIIELLAEVSRDKLVIVVTHNFEELQHVATRKITIHDGAVVEDQQLRRMPSASKAVPTTGEATVIGTAGQHPQAVTSESDEAPIVVSPKHRSQPSLVSRLQDLLLMSTRHLAAVPFKSVLMFLVLLLLSFGSAFGYGTMQDINDGLSLRSSSLFFANSSEQRVVVNKADHSAFTTEERKALTGSPQVDELIEADSALDQQLSVELPKRLSKNGAIVTSGIAPWSSLHASSLIAGRAPQAEGEVALNTRALRKGIEAEDVLDRTFDFTYGDGGTKFPLKIVGIADSKKVGEVAFVPASVIDTVAKEAIAQYKTMSFSIGDMEPMLFTPLIEAAAKADKDGAADAKAAGSDRQPLPPQTVDINSAFATLYCSSYKADGGTCAEQLAGRTMKVEASGMFNRTELTFTIRGVNRAGQSEQAPVVYFRQSDYETLAQDQQPYQLSLMTASDADSRQLVASLRAQGYNAIYPHETLEPQSRFAPILKVIVIGIFLIGFIGVFILISYFILRTIMKSKRRDYVILRSIGASQRLVNRLTFTEMLLLSTVSLIAAWIVAKLCGWLPESSVTRAVSKVFAYFSWLDYMYLYLILVLIVLGLTSHMRKKLFSESVMATYKGEEGSAA